MGTASMASRPAISTEAANYRTGLSSRLIHRSSCGFPYRSTKNPPGFLNGTAPVR
jgi:hypothetical protein